jgi:hypothetical protein
MGGITYKINVFKGAVILEMDLCFSVTKVSPQDALKVFDISPFNNKRTHMVHSYYIKIKDQFSRGLLFSRIL